ncbi:MAG: DNA-directed RNA polymerase subunit omega [Thermoanaerobaculia bacterium]|nr:DNA-directed RNA polymerase subunit omega [Thermoanaerobaculia bacterium]
MTTLPEKIDSKFRYVLLAARRAEDMMRGATPKVSSPSKFTSAAMREIGEDLVQWEYGVAEPEADDEEE